MHAQPSPAQPSPDQEIAALRREMQALRREVATTRARRRRSPSARLGAAATLALLVALVPLGLLAAGPFNDLTGGPHDANIAAIYAAGITKGCVPDVSYCPTDNVTRQEMASFLARTAGLGGNPPVANALTAVNATNAANATNATNATNAAHATSADTATTATTATNATNATNATTATTAANATTAQTANRLATNPAGAKTFAASDLLRVAVAGVTDGTNTTFAAGLNNFQTLTSLTITAPQAGYVLVNSATEAAMRATSGCPCQVGARIRHDTGGTVIFSNNDYLANAVNASNNNAVAMMASTWVFPVNPGVNTFSLEASVFTGSPAASTIDFSRYRLTALFVPFNSTGVAP